MIVCPGTEFRLNLRRYKNRNSHGRNQVVVVVDVRPLCRKRLAPWYIIYVAYTRGTGSSARYVHDARSCCILIILLYIDARSYSIDARNLIQYVLEILLPFQYKPPLPFPFKSCTPHLYACVVFYPLLALAKSFTILYAHTLRSSVHVQCTYCSP